MQVFIYAAYRRAVINDNFDWEMAKRSLRGLTSQKVPQNLGFQGTFLLLFKLTGEDSQSL